MKVTERELNLPAGFRFHPTDEELVVHYLCRRCAGDKFAVPIIAEIDLYKFDPWQLPDMALYGEKEWYFFSPRDRKYPNGSRPNRTAGNGYWKATGADKPVGKPKTLAIKKALVFYAGKAPKGVKTNWIMHEYRLANVDRSAGKRSSNLRLDDWVLCRIYNKKGTIEKHYYNVGHNEAKFSDSEFEEEYEEEEKPRGDALFKQTPKDHFMQFPKLRTDSSCSTKSEAPQSEITSWSEALDFQLSSCNVDYYGFQDYEDPFGSEMEIYGYYDEDPLFQDLFLSSTQKPF